MRSFVAYRKRLILDDIFTYFSRYANVFPLSDGWASKCHLGGQFLMSASSTSSSFRLTGKPSVSD